MMSASTTSSVRETKAGVSIDDLADDIAPCALLTSLNVSPEVDAEDKKAGIGRTQGEAGTEAPNKKA